jgi:leucyl/phenylalanyl-tRNA---protein transferase
VVLSRLARSVLSLGGSTWKALADWFGRRRRRTLRVLLPGSEPTFPDPAEADHHGLIAIGGDLSVDRLLAAYRHGIFPWYDNATPILWWSPDPRAVFDLDGFHISRRLARTVRSGKFRVTIDSAFAEVVEACSQRDGGTWITRGMKDAYLELHRLGHAHSVEVWDGKTLAGGVYGVALGGLFAGESMFTRVRDGSKVALVYLFEHLRERGYVLFDAQYLNDHTASLGGREISRAEYLARLREALGREVRFG